MTPKADSTARTASGAGCVNAAPSHTSAHSASWGKASSSSPPRSQLQRCHTSTPAADADAASTSSAVPVVRSLAKTIGEASPPRIPSAAIPCESRRTATAVPAAPTANASSAASAAGIRWWTGPAMPAVTKPPPTAAAISAFEVVAWRIRSAASIRPVESTAARPVRASGPNQPLENAIPASSASPSTSAAPPVHAISRPPTSASSAARSNGL